MNLQSLNSMEKILDFKIIICTINSKTTFYNESFREESDNDENISDRL
jgi:hypothetical protein